MNSRLAMSLALAISLLTICGPSWAHHGNAAYIEGHPITIMGTATEFVWNNPHCQIYLDVMDDKGEIIHWAVESQSPGILHRNGWTKDSIMPGDKISVTLIPAKNGAPVGFAGGSWGKVVFGDGHTLVTAGR